MSQANKLSVILCTYNRADLLAQVLDALKEQYIDFSTKHNSHAFVEVMIVDNNSTDTTKSLIEGYQSKDFPLRYEFEGAQGLSYARNRGVESATGEFIAFIDDDIYLDSQWLNEAFKLVSQSNSDTQAFGGRVIPKWLSEIPDWLNIEPPYEIIQSVFPAHDYGEEEKNYPFKFGSREIYNPIGANMIFKKSLFERYGNFRVDLGVTGKQVGLCEDTEFCRLLLKNNVLIKYVPQCKVTHPVFEKRMTKDFIKHWYFILGKSLYHLMHTDRSQEKSKNNTQALFVGVPQTIKKIMPSFFETIKIAGVPIYLYLKLMSLSLLWLVMHLSFDAKKLLWFDLQRSKTSGEMAAAKDLIS